MDLETLRRKLSEALADKEKAGALLSEIDAAQAEIATLNRPSRREFAAARKTLAEYYDGTPYIATYGAKSFKDLDAATSANERAEEVGELTEAYRQIIGNIMYSDEAPAAKLTALRQLSDEFMGRVTTALQVTATETARPTAPTGEVLAESIGGANVTLAETEAPATGPRAPLDINVRLIKPGWGNSRDRHYYSAAMLRRDAGLFEGVKMYTTDHNAAEKSERTEVSKIKAIERFDTDGAPIARVTIFDPDFAEKTRNRIAAGMTDSLECSILAAGMSKAGKAPDGREGNIVEAITAVQSVDWVTKAGAGGGAVSLAEAAAGDEIEMKPTVADIKAAVAGLAEVEVDPADLDAIIAALEALKGAAGAVAADTAAVDAAAGAADAVAAASEVAASVAAEVAKSSLPATAKARLGAAKYATLAEAQTAITAEVAYLKTITGSGQPHNPAPAALAEAQPVNLAERAAVSNHILDGVLGKRPARQ